MTAGSTIHSSAIIQPGAEISQGCKIGPYSIIGANVKLGPNCEIGSHVVLDGHTTIGAGTRIFPFAAIGTDPQDLKFSGEPSVLEIGERNIIREYVTIQAGTAHGTMRTTVGNENLFMCHSHVGHDCIVGSNNWFANSVALSGHVTIGSRVILGGLAGVHQFVEVGDLAFIGAGAMVAQDIPPYCMSQGDRARLTGINKVGLKRAGFSEEEVRRVIQVFRDLFIRKSISTEDQTITLTLANRIERAKERAANCPRASKLIDFVAGDRPRGIAAARSAGE